MKKNITFFAMVLALATITSSMEKGNEDNAVSWPCFIAMLPPEIQGMIAQYLVFNDREDDYEFVERTKKLIPALVPSDEIYPQETKKIIHGTSPNNSKTISAQDHIMEINGDDCRTWFRTKIDIRYKYNKPVTINNDPIEGIYFWEDRCRDETTHATAIANDGNIFAYIRKKEGTRVYNATITSRLLNYAPNTFEISGPLAEVACCAFNKQGTKFIVHDIDRCGQSRRLIYLISTNGEHKEKSEKTLAEYFRQKGICKNLAASLPQHHS